MEKEFCTVQTGDKVKCYERGIAYKKIAEEFQEEYPAKIVLALVDGTRLQSAMGITVQLTEMSFWIRSFWIRLMQGCMNLQKPKFRSRSVLCIHRMQ